MNKQEVRRFAHGLAADLLTGYPVGGGEDGEAIAAALGAIAEQHRRYGPKSTDRPPRRPKVWEMPLFDKSKQALLTD